MPGQPWVFAATNDGNVLPLGCTEATTGGILVVMTTLRARTPATQATTNYGSMLAAWIERCLPNLKTSWRSFALANGIEPTRLIAWRRGAVPGLEQLALVATAFGVTRLDVLVAAGFLSPGETETAHIEVMVSDVDSAIETDPSLSDAERDFLRHARKLAKTSGHE